MACSENFAALAFPVWKQCEKQLKSSGWNAGIYIFDLLNNFNSMLYVPIYTTAAM